MTNYQVTIGYKAIITINVKAENEKEAKDWALEVMKMRRDKMRNKDLNIEDDNFKADGVLDMDATWNDI